MDEDLECTEDRSKKHGGNFRLKARDTTPGEDFWKVSGKMQPLKKKMLNVSFTSHKSCHKPQKWHLLY